MTELSREDLSGRACSRCEPRLRMPLIAKLIILDFCACARVAMPIPRIPSIDYRESRWLRRSAATRSSMYGHAHSATRTMRLREYVFVLAAENKRTRKG